MSHKRTRQFTGIMFIMGAILINIPYTLLIINFDYPDILRLPAGEILERFASGGAPLIWTWLAFAWVGMPILLGILLLPKAVKDESPLGHVALFFGALGAIIQMIGLLRWPFVVSVLARLYTDPQASAVTKEAVLVVFQAVHQYGGVVLGEHIGQLFTIFWLIVLCLGFWRSRLFPRWLPVTGFVAAILYALAQGELLQTAMPDFPVWGPAGLVGSLMWLGWLIALGSLLLRGVKKV